MFVQERFSGHRLNTLGRVATVKQCLYVTSIAGRNGANRTRDEGGPLGFGEEVADPKPPRVAAVKSRSDERRGKVGKMIPPGK